MPAEQIRDLRVPPGLLADVDQVLRDHGVDAQPSAILHCLSWLPGEAITASHSRIPIRGRDDLCRLSRFRTIKPRR